MPEWNTRIDQGPLFARRNTHQHSAMALKAQEAAGTTPKRCQAILGVLRASNRNMTDREIKDALDFSDMNSVRPRITEMIRDGILEEAGSVACPVTSMTVRCVRVKDCEE